MRSMQAPSPKFRKPLNDTSGARLALRTAPPSTMVRQDRLAHGGASTKASVEVRAPQLVLDAVVAVLHRKLAF
jgi:hypothetical protein